MTKADLKKLFSKVSKYSKMAETAQKHLTNSTKDAKYEKWKELDRKHWKALEEYQKAVREYVA